MTTQRGKLRQWIVIERYVTPGGDFDDEVGQWQTVHERWAEFKPAKVRQIAGDNTLEFIRSAEFVVENAAAVMEADRIVWGERVFTVEAVREQDAVQQWYALEVAEQRQSTSDAGDDVAEVDTGIQTGPSQFAGRE